MCVCVCVCVVSYDNTEYECIKYEWKRNYPFTNRILMLVGIIRLSGIFLNTSNKTNVKHTNTTFRRHLSNSKCPLEAIQIAETEFDVCLCRSHWILFCHCFDPMIRKKRTKFLIGFVASHFDGRDDICTICRICTRHWASGVYAPIYDPYSHIRLQSHLAEIIIIGWTVYTLLPNGRHLTYCKRLS